MKTFKVRCKDGRLAVFQINDEKNEALLEAYDHKGKMEDRRVVTVEQARELWRHLARTVGGRLLK